MIANHDPKAIDRIAVGVLGLLAVVAALTFRDYGLGWDDYTHSQYAELLLSFYTSGFKDQRAFSFVNLYYYGGGFDVAALLLSKALPIGLFETRRLLGAAIGLAFAAPAILAAGAARAQPQPESAFDRVRRTKTLRIAVLPGELPYFQKDLASGERSGACIEMAKSIASAFDAKLEYVESTYGNSVLDLQSNKIDLAFALNPTPARALSIGFTHPMIVHPYGCLAKKGLAPKTWDDLNKPDIKIVFDLS